MAEGLIGLFPIPLLVLLRENKHLKTIEKTTIIIAIKTTILTVLIILINSIISKLEPR
jgi:hypothetical protein